MGFNKTDYNSEYNKRNYKSFAIRFNIKTEADIIDYLKNQNVKSYLADLIRKDMRKDQRSKGTIAGPEYRHNHPETWCYEVIEDLPNDHYSIGYAETLDEAKQMIIDYTNEGVPSGMIYIVERMKSNQGGVQIAGRRL